MANCFFTSDEHYGHANIIQFCHRPFESLEDQTEQLIERHNFKVGTKDVTYHLGDMFWRRVSIPEANSIMDRLNGKHYLILGNHDEVANRIAGRFEWVRETSLVQTPTRVWLSHYAQRVWPESHRGSWHVYGHTHNVLPDYRYSTDVGVDAKNYFPVSYDELGTHMAAKGTLPPDEVQADMLKSVWLKEGN
jgi:calcineurin-like phosphoesterase family protein